MTIVVDGGSELFTEVHTLTHGTFSIFMRTLRESGLVEEQARPESEREKMYRITGSGEIAFRFFSNPATSSLVRSLLEK